MRKVRRLLFFVCVAFLVTSGFYIFNSVLQVIFAARSGLHIITEIDRFGEVHTISLRNFNPDDFLLKYQADKYSDYGYNVNRSLQIPWNRTISDQRQQGCRYTLRPSKELSTASIIIAIQNEAPSVVLRMVVSILRQSPPKLLKGIIIIDDSGKENDFYHTSLSTIPKVSIYGFPEEKGQVASLLFGAKKATGEVLVFVSGTGEVTNGWLEPLLERIQRKPNVVVGPVIDAINSETFSYEFTNSDQKAVFDWGLSVKWQKLATETDHIFKTTQPIVSPVLEGEVMAIDKNHFLKLGKFDPGLENSRAAGLELSLKSWMCGGTVEIVSCSHIGLIKKRRRSSTKKGNSISIIRDLRRVAEVWMDGYKRFFYANRPGARMTSHGSVAERRRLRSQLKCRPFKWYLDTVVPQLKPLFDEDFVFGQIRQGTDMCMDMALGHVPVLTNLNLCSEEKNSQEWTWKKKGMIKNHGMCLTADLKETHGYVLMQYCSGANSQLWFRQNDLIVHEVSKQCIDSHKAEMGLVLSECEEQLQSQRWTLPQAADTA